MTGGQPMDGPLDPAMITRQLYAEGVSSIVVVSDEPNKYPIGTEWAPGVSIEHRDRLDAIQRDFREREGVTVILYDQTCAAEKRRRRKRGLYPDPAHRVFINEAVCEGCGDCSVQSNCLSVVPLETEFGRKRAIDQSSCNKDFSCLKGFCPSFVSVRGGKLRKPEGATKRRPGESPFPALPEPTLPALNEPYGVLVTGVGGTGVVTIGALLGMAAHIENKGATVLDMTGLAQKGGAVVSHVRIAPSPEDIHAVRISAGGANLVLGCDLVVAAGFESVSKMDKGHTAAVVNTQETPTAAFTRDPDFQFPGQRMHALIEQAVGRESCSFVDATRLATALLGNSIATNLFMLGFAWQRGLVPVGEEALMAAIELNGVAIEANKRAFLWGRRAAHDPAAVEAMATPKEPVEDLQISHGLDEVIERRGAFLTDYQDAAYAARYRALVERVRTAESAQTPGREALSEAVARYYFKLLAYKDEYEVARLYSDPAFEANVEQQFDGDYKLGLHLAPPLFARRDPDSGLPVKREFGPWIFKALRLLAKFKGLRGTALDLFGYSEERRLERKLIADYETLVDELIAGLDQGCHNIAVELAEIPEQIRGYGHVKQAHIEKAKAREAQLLEAFRSPAPAAASAAE